MGRSARISSNRLPNRRTDRLPEAPARPSFFAPCQGLPNRPRAQCGARLPRDSLLPGPGAGDGEHSAAARRLRMLIAKAEARRVAQTAVEADTCFGRPKSNGGSRR